MLAADEDPLELVSSFYGPGVVGCWYLTVLACIVSWTVHPVKRLAGSVDSDFIAVLTFPAVSAGHLIIQARHFPSRDDNTLDQIRIIKLAAALEAPLNVTETFLALSVVLLLIAVLRKCVRRALLVAVAGLFSFSSEIVLRTRELFLESSHAAFGRLYLVNYTWLLIVLCALLGALVMFALGVVSMFYAKQPRRFNPRRPARTWMIPNQTTRQHPLAIESLNQIQSTSHPDDFVSSRSAWLLTPVSMVFLPVSFIASLIPISTNAATFALDAPHEVLRWIIATASRFYQDLWPRTGNSIEELDQAVAVLAGATVLCFSIYGAASAHYVQHKRKQHREIELLERREEVRLQQLQSRLLHART
ncbi:MAG: hypothetical protein Q9218_004964 [Villophora microphyllina]